jgi:hypothetical protein
MLVDTNSIHVGNKRLLEAQRGSTRSHSVKNYRRKRLQTSYKTGYGMIMIIIIFISFMQGIYTYIPETNHVPREYSIAATLLLLFMVPISLFPALTPLYLYVSTFQSMCTVPNMAVFCSSLTSWIPDMLLTYFMNGF